MSGNFTWVCICILGGGHFSFPDADADPRTTGLALTVLQYCHLLSDFSSKFQSSVTIFHHKLLTRGGRVLANGWTHPSSMTMFVVYLYIRSVIQKVTIVTYYTK